MFHDIPKEKLDVWWRETCVILSKDPGNWNALRDQTLLENEYQRRGWQLPTTL